MAVLPPQIASLFQMLDGSGDGLLCLDQQLQVVKLNRTAKDWFVSSNQFPRLQEHGLSCFLPSIAADRLLKSFGAADVADQAPVVAIESTLIHVTLADVDQSNSRPDGDLTDIEIEEESGSNARTLELRLQRIDTKVRDAADHQDNFLVLGIARDVTSRIGIERALDGARRAAEQASAAKTDILYSVSHDIRTPLNGALGFLELLRKTKLDSQQLEYVRTVDRSTRSLMDIIDQLLDMARIEAGYLDFEPTSTDVDKLLIQCVELHQLQARAKQLNLTYKRHGTKTDCQVQVDSARLAQVVNNLITNAIKFTGEGSVSVDMSATTKDRHTRHIEIKVTDTGIGIYPDEMEKLFDAYQRSQRAQTRRAGGVGLGLAISRRLVSGLGGNIDVQSQPNQGSVFKVSIDLPVPLEYSPPAQPVRRPQSRGEVSSSRRPKILVVDDNDINLSYIVTMLGHHDVEVIAAGGGEQAINELKETRPDLVILDIHMPVANGFDVFYKINEIYGSTRPPVIALTADASKELRADIDYAGFDDQLFKPASEHDFLNILQQFTGLQISQTLSDPPEHEPMSVIDRTFGIHMAGDNEQLWLQNLALFSDQLRDIVSSLDQTELEFSQSFVADISHRIAGTASYLGAGELTRQARFVQDCSRDPDHTNLSAEVRQLVSVSETFLQTASELVANLPDSTPLEIN